MSRLRLYTLLGNSASLSLTVTIQTLNDAADCTHIHLKMDQGRVFAVCVCVGGVHHTPLPLLMLTQARRVLPVSLPSAGYPKWHTRTGSARPCESVCVWMCAHRSVGDSRSALDRIQARFFFPSFYITHTTRPTVWLHVLSALGQGV